MEYEMNGVPSALMATGADWWIFYDDEVMFSLTPKEIIQVIFNTKLTHVQFVGSGDRSVKKAFLIPKDWLIEKSRIIEDYRF